MQVRLCLCFPRWFDLLSVGLESLSVTIEMKATELYIPTALFVVVIIGFFFCNMSVLNGRL